MLFQPTWEMVKSHRDPRSVLSVQSMQIATPTGRKPVAAACFARSACCFGPNGNRTFFGIGPPEHVEYAERAGMSEGVTTGGMAMVNLAGG